jgi:hypothetical protein
MSVVSDPYPGLPVNIYNCLIGRLAVLQVLARHRARLYASDLAALHQDLYHSLRALTDPAISWERDNSTLRDFLYDLVTNLRQRLDSTKPAAAGDQYSRVFEEIAACVESLLQGGREPLLDTFNNVIDATVAYYNHCKVDIAAACPQDVQFTAKHSEEKPHTFDVPYYTTAHTDFDQGSTIAVSTVALTICAKSFDWDTYLAIPYVLFHESVCHVFQAQCKQEKAPSVRNCFSEGWMDFVAYSIHTAVMEGTGTGALFAKRFPHRQGHKEAGHVFHRSRCTPSATDTRSFSFRLLGVEAARRMFSLLAVIPETASDPSVAFLRLSMAINASSISHIERDEFAWRVHARLPAELTSLEEWDGDLDVRGFVAISNMRNLLLQYFENQDVAKFVESVISEESLVN